MHFFKKKNSTKERIFFNKNNDDLVEELREKGFEVEVDKAPC